MTPEGWTVTVWAAIVAFIGAAALAFYWSFRAATPEQAASLRTIALACVGIAFVIFVGKKLVAIFLDS